MSDRLPTIVSVAGLTHPGHARTLNEDCFRVSEIGGALQRGPDEVVERVSSPAGFVLGVYDGTGGTGAGDAASRAAARVVSEALATGALPSGPAELSVRLVEAVTAAGAAILAEASASADRRGMGSTATVAALAGEHLVVAQVGDSRAYLLRGRELVQITRDDTLLQEVLRTGRLSPADAASFPHKNVLLQVLGTGRELKVSVSTVVLHHGDRVLLCTDGIHGLLEDAVLRATLLRHRDPGTAARVLLDEALRAGGLDNIALVIARPGSEGLPSGEAGLEVTSLGSGRT